MIQYKYTKTERGIAILRELRLKVSPPNEFNDPFELTPATASSIASLEGEQLAPLNDWLQREGLADSSIEGLQKVLPELMRTNPTVRKFASELVCSDMAARDAASQHFGVLCLSEHRANIRMWAHYGDENRGVAVGFDFDKETSGIAGAISLDKVEYTSARPRLNPMLPVGAAFHEQMLKITSTKSEVWQDELEHRMLFQLTELHRERRNKGYPKIRRLLQNCRRLLEESLISHVFEPRYLGSDRVLKEPLWNYFVHIRPETIREVAMGCFISPPDERTIRSVIKVEMPHVKLLKMRRHETEFQFEAVAAD